MVRKRRISLSKSKRRKQGLFRPLLLFLLAVVLLGGISLLISYFLLKKDGEAEPSLSEIVISKKKDTIETQPASPVEQDFNTDTPLHNITWVSTLSGAMLTIEGSRYTIDFPSVEEHKPMTGAISITDQGFSVVNHDSDDICKNLTGKYRYTFKADELVIELVDDDCIKRSRTLNAAWFPL